MHVEYRELTFSASLGFCFLVSPSPSLFSFSFPSLLIPIPVFGCFYNQLTEGVCARFFVFVIWVLDWISLGWFFGSCCGFFFFFCLYKLPPRAPPSWAFPFILSLGRICFFGVR